jgi:hypothetical protein
MVQLVDVASHSRWDSSRRDGERPSQRRSHPTSPCHPLEAGELSQRDNFYLAPRQRSHIKPTSPTTSSPAGVQVLASGASGKK